MIKLERFQHISVLGAAGKMGSGILLLNVLHSAKMKHLPDFVGKTFVINAIDQSYDQLDQVNDYLKVQVQKWAESNIIWLRKAFNNRPHLIDNKDVIETFVFEALSLVKPAITKEAAYQSTLVFEAIVEDEGVKAEVLGDIKANNPHDPWFLTNTSSIPIHVLDEKAKLGGNIIGCHFYNPPAVQKLIEVIETKNGNPDLLHLVNGFGKEMKKIMVPSNDVAGFIGNGFFMREILYAGQLVNRLMPELYLTDAITAVDIITRDLLVRPMGIFQLIDYVGIDVCHFILEVMAYYLDKEME
ncbi:MAG: 3-hydroxyacyl-CoA dehydrogenase family protein, partial [Marinilabiliaceae bacterium]|nr:3-hydroxyacyl-CoA dehydrogenase family protein [Marinilabiliaceae bacterium]